MPNPLILTTAAPHAPGKPEAKPRQSPETEGARAFQDVLDEDAAEPALDNDETEVVIVDATPDSESATAEPAVTEQPLPVVKKVESAPYVSPEEPVSALVQASTTPQYVPEPNAGTVNKPEGAVQAAAIRTDAEGQPETHPRIAANQMEPARETVPSDGARRAPASQIAEQAVIMRAITQVPVRNAEPPSAPAPARAEPAKPVAPTNPTAPVMIKAASMVAQQAQLQSTPSPGQSDEKAETGLVAEPDGLATPKGDAMLPSRDVVQNPSFASARAEVARAVAGQMAAVITARPSPGAVEIALNPEELGRVSILLNGREDGLHLTIAVERPETLELMRRHIAVLSTEFQKLGYSDLSFDLGSSADTPWEGGTDKSDTLFDADDPQPEPVAITHPSPTGLTHGLDMRL